jgi:hypothetical protein
MLVSYYTEELIPCSYASQERSTMTHPTTARPVFDATTLATLSRAIRLLQETAVQNDWREAARDWKTVIHAGRRAIDSTRRASGETATFWRRNGGEASSADSTHPRAEPSLLLP